MYMSQCEGNSLQDRLDFIIEKCNTIYVNSDRKLSLSFSHNDYPNNKGDTILFNLITKTVNQMGFKSLFVFENKATPEQLQQLFNILQSYIKNLAFL
jgi:hypothetical protein